MIATAPMQGGSEYDQTPMPELSEQQFQRWAALLEQRLGIAVTAQRKAFLSSKLRTRMRELSLGDFEDYYQVVTASAQAALEWTRLLDMLTIHETSFYRHPASYALLSEQVVPQWLQQAGNELVNIKAWSVGCASGEEAYSLAMLLHSALLNHQGKGYFGVIGTDVSLESLAIARNGIYSAQRLAGMNARTVSRYFTRLGDEYQVAEQIRQRTAFSQLNVQELENAPFEKVDIIFCQNLLIYFSQQKRREILNTLAGFLKPDGVMVLGVGEVVDWQAEGLEPMKIKDTLAYRRIKD